MNGIVLRYDTAAIRGTKTIIHRFYVSFNIDLRKRGGHSSYKGTKIVAKAMQEEKIFLRLKISTPIHISRNAVIIKLFCSKLKVKFF